MIKAMHVEAIRLYQSGHSTVCVGEILGINNTTVGKILRKHGHHVRPRSETSRQYPVDEKYFDEIDSEQKAYWLGFIAADGCVERDSRSGIPRTVSISASAKDMGHIGKFKAAIKSGAPVKDTLSHGFRISVISIHSERLARSLLKYGITPNKSLTLKPNLSCIPTEHHHHYWRGMVDGDGCLSFNKSNRQWMVRLAGTESVCRQFAQWVREVADVHCCISVNNGLYSANIGSQNGVRKILKCLYGNVSVALDRKDAIARRFLKELE